jgi:hypothetical protein
MPLDNKHAHSPTGAPGNLEGRKKVLKTSIYVYFYLNLLKIPLFYKLALCNCTDFMPSFEKN